MKILDCTEFANEWDAKRHYTDGPWSDELNWKGYINQGNYTHVIVDGNLYTISKYGPKEAVAEITTHKE